MKVCIVQSLIEDTLPANLHKYLAFIDLAKGQHCELVVFPESSLYRPEVAVETATADDLGEAIREVGRRAQAAQVCVVFGATYPPVAGQGCDCVGVAYDERGSRVLSYVKNKEVPRPFVTHGVLCNLCICSDRGYIEHSDLPSLMHGVQVIIDTSGGHGGDDGRPHLRFIRYRPWALRTNAFVIVSNPPHEDTDFMGNSPWGGCSAVVRPDGAIQASLGYETDATLVEEIDLSLIAARTHATQRSNSPLFGPFWDMGARLISGENVEAMANVTPYVSAVRSIKVAVAQMACGSHLEDNVEKIRHYIRQAAEHSADIVVFPELAVTGSADENVRAATQEALEWGVARIGEEAAANAIHVVFGAPYFARGARRNCAFVIGDDGQVKTRYEQIATARIGLFQPGASTKRLWFQLRGVHAIVTIGADSDWIEIPNLAAYRGMNLHFHISCGGEGPDATLRKLRQLQMLRYARFGAAANAAHSCEPGPVATGKGGGSMIVSREGGHGKPMPKGLEHYLPYHTSIVASVGPGEALIFATRETSADNDCEHWRNTSYRMRRVQQGWWDWINMGMRLVDQ
jgi:predicted amidohydrolase